MYSEGREKADGVYAIDERKEQAFVANVAIRLLCCYRAPCALKTDLDLKMVSSN